MRIQTLLTAAEEQLGYQVVDGTIDDAHFILFVKDYKVEGFIKNGRTFNYPDDVAALDATA
tara:strand:- start:1786 stop:1968 length:183 start_codon:yes stop_codon:yes gene_type:complete